MPTTVSIYTKHVKEINKYPPLYGCIKLGFRLYCSRWLTVVTIDCFVKYRNVAKYVGVIIMFAKEIDIHYVMSAIIIVVTHHYHNQPMKQNNPPQQIKFNHYLIELTTIFQLFNDVQLYCYIYKGKLHD